MGPPQQCCYSQPDDHNRDPSDPDAGAADPACPAVVLHAAVDRHVPAGAAGHRRRPARHGGRHPAHFVGLHDRLWRRPDLLRAGRRPFRPAACHPGRTRRLCPDQRRLRFRDGGGPPCGVALPAGAGGVRRRGAGAYHGARPRRARPGGARHVADDGLHVDRAHAGAAARRADPVVPGLAGDLLGAGRDRRGGARRCVAAPARDAAAGISPAAGPVLGAEALRRAGASSRLHGLRLHQHVPVLGAVVVPVRLALRVHRALRRGAARLRPDLRRHDRVHDPGQPAQRQVRAGVRRRQDPALCGDRAGRRRADRPGAGPDRGALRHDRHVAVPSSASRRRSPPSA